VFRRHCNQWCSHGHGWARAHFDHGGSKPLGFAEIRSFLRLQGYQVCYLISILYFFENAFVSCRLCTHIWLLKAPPPHHIKQQHTKVHSDRKNKKKYIHRAVSKQEKNLKYTNIHTVKSSRLHKLIRSDGNCYSMNLQIKFAFRCIISVFTSYHTQTWT